MSQSKLNPEGPAFHPSLETTIRSGYQLADQAVRISNTFPFGASYDHYKTFSDFNNVISEITKGVLALSNAIMMTELPSVKLKCGEEYNDENTEKIIDANDSLLDRVNINIDTLSGVYQPSTGFLSGVASGSSGPVVSTIKLGSTTFIGAKNIPRPQLLFKDRVDNSQNLFIPKIQDKPNNIKPLALQMIYDEEGRPLGFEHPYKIELEQYEPPADALAVPSPSPSPSHPAPSPAHSAPLTHVDTEEALERLLLHLDRVSEIAVDLEHHSFRTYQGITCLIQMTTDSGGDFIVDAIALREHIHRLNQSFTDPKKVKVFHGGDNDVVWLQRDFGVYVVGMFDTQQAARLLRCPGLALKDLLLRYCGLDVDKRYRLADWRIRPLPAELVTYARTDTHYLLYIYRELKRLLAERDPSLRLLRAAFDRSRDVAMRTYSQQPVDERSYLQLYRASRKSFDHKQTAALSALYLWRDQRARELDESPVYLLPNHMLLSLAESLPREVQGVLACCVPTPPFVKENALHIHRLILACRERAPAATACEMPTSVLNMCVSSAAPSPAALDLPASAHYGGDYSLQLDRSCRYEGAVWALSVRAGGGGGGGGARAGGGGDTEQAAMVFPPYEQYLMYRACRQAEELKSCQEPAAPPTASVEPLTCAPSPAPSPSPSPAPAHTEPRPGPPTAP